MSQVGNGKFDKSIFAHEPILTVESRLWRAVLEQAFADAEVAPNCGDIAFEPFESAAARQYLRADNPKEAEHLLIVCDFASIPADRLILWARRRYPLVPVTDLDEVSEVREVKEIEEVKDRSAVDSEGPSNPLLPLRPSLPLPPICPAPLIA